MSVVVVGSSSPTCMTVAVSEVVAEVVSVAAVSVSVVGGSPACMSAVAVSVALVKFLRYVTVIFCPYG